MLTPLEDEVAVAPGIAEGVAEDVAQGAAAERGAGGVANDLAKTPIASHRTLQAAIEAIGARVLFTTPDEHDRTLAYTSHLPQMLSTALALTLEAAFGTAHNPGLQIHAGGLRSMLRLARSEPAMWEQIAASNQQNIAEALACLEAELKALRERLGRPDFRPKFEQAREFAKFIKG